MTATTRASRRAAFLWCLTALALLTGAVTAQPSSTPIGDGPDVRSLDTPDGPRTYRVTTPSIGEPSADAPPLVVVLHWNGGSGREMATTSDFDAVAARHGAVVAYPDGAGGTWNYVRGIPGYPEAPDDTAFLRSLVATLQAEFGTDPTRTYAVGFSNGGFMAQRLLCEAPDVFAGAVSVSAAGFAGLDGICDGAVARSLALIHGTADSNVPWDGLPVDVPGGTVLITWPVPTTFAWWAERSGCQLPADRTNRPGDPTLGATSIVVLELDDCEGDHRVALIALVGGGHGWPRGATFDAAREAWSFLSSVALRD